MTEAVTDAVMTIAQPGQPIDLHMIEIMSMTHKLGSDSRFVKGLVRRSYSVIAAERRSYTRSVWRIADCTECVVLTDV